MKSSGSTITTRGRTTVPPEIRRTLGLTAGTRLDWQVLNDGRLRVHVKSKMGPDDKELGALADAAKDSADRAAAAIDSAMDFIAASNKRIAALAAKVAKP